MKHLKRILVVVALLGLSALAGIWSDYSVGRKSLTPKAVPSGTLLMESAPANPKKEKSVELGFDVLKKWTYVEGKTPIPGFIRVFDGKNVAMTGYMMPLSDIKDIKSFVLVPSLFGCCYGQPPQPNHVVVVKMAGDAKTKFYDDLVCVRGEFHCGEEKQDGYVVSLYHIDAEQVVTQ